MRAPHLCFIAALASCTLRGQVIDSFHPGRLDQDGISAEFKGAVLSVESGENSLGTGFLIDRINGFILTAAHVVANRSELYVISPMIPGRRFPVRIVQELARPEPDIALLQLVTAGALAGIRPIDVVFQTPRKSSTVYAMGYPVVEEGMKPPYQEQKADRMASMNGTIQVNQASFPGNSGGPLLDESGCAVAICRQKVGVGATVALYTPIKASKVLLDRIPLNPRMQALDAQVRAKQITAEELARQLLKTAENPTNVDLYSWVQRIVAQPNLYKPLSDLFDYPVLRAFIHRGLDDLVIQLSAFANARLLGHAALAVAQSESELGHNLTALQNVTTAIAALRAAGDTQGETRAQLLAAQLYVAQSDVGMASPYLAFAKANASLLPLPEQAEIVALSGSTARSSGKLDEAIQQFTIATHYFRDAQLLSNAAGTLTSRGKIKLTLGEHESAQADLNLAANYFAQADNKEDQSKVLYELAGVQIAKGQKARAVVTLNKFLAVAPNNFTALRDEALAYVVAAAPKGEF